MHRAMLFLGVLFLWIFPILKVHSQFIPFAVWQTQTTPATPATPCNSEGGAEVNGQCWFLGATNQGCDDVCGATTSYNNVHSDTVNQVGSGGTNPLCEAVLDAFPASGSATVSNASNDRGCQVNSGATDRRRGTQTTSLTSQNSSWRRACACTLNTQTAPATIAWADFIGLSSSETFSDLGTTAITLEVSAAYTSGAPVFEYSQNGGAWTNFTPGGAASLSINNQDTLQFRASGTNGHTGTITISNISDSNRIIDTIGVTASDDPCVLAGGAKVNSQCWILGAANSNCASTCNVTGFVGTHSDTIFYAGSSGTNSQCEAVLDAFPGTGSSAVSTTVDDRGCQAHVTNGQRRRGTTDPTSYTAQNSNWHRACACVPVGSVQIGNVDWPNFNDLSLTKTITDIATTVTLEMSASFTSGTPTIEYRKNTNVWTNFTPGASANDTFVNGDSLTFRVSGTVGERASITIRNLSDSNVVVDMVMGTVNRTCSDGHPAIGTVCPGGTIFAGQFDNGRYMVTPANCTDSSTPTCDGSTDTLVKKWNGSFGTNSDIPGVENIATVETPSSSNYRGDINTAAMVAHPSVGSDSAAHYCHNMIFAGYSDWYLPSKSELAYIFCYASSTATHNTLKPEEDVNCASQGGKTSVIPGFSPFSYWSSTERNSSNVHSMFMGTGGQGMPLKDNNLRVRCVRRY